jgi:predicted neutral ceramidase superfamily lipid hydrolase
MVRTATSFAVSAGSVGSVAFLLLAGWRHSPAVLLLIFAIWVLAPFAALILAKALWKRRPVRTAALIIGVASPIVYGYAALRLHLPTATPVFVTFPAASLLLTAIAVLLARLGSVREIKVRRSAATTAAPTASQRPHG